MAKKKAASVPPKLTETEQDLLSHMQRGTNLKQIRSAATQFCGGRRMMKEYALCPPIAIRSRRWNSADSSAPAKVATLSPSRGV
jgi:hypothetical protein